MEIHILRTKKQAVLLVMLVAAAIAISIFTRWFRGRGPDISTLEGRCQFLSSLGWEIDPDSEACRNITLPAQMDGLMEDYCRMQLEQGYDLAKHAGQPCLQYTYTLTNYPDVGSTVYITIYVQKKSVIAGDIHTASLDGFMHGIVRAQTP